MVRAADVRRIAFSIYWKGTLLGILASSIGAGSVGFVLGVVGGVLGIDLHISLPATVTYMVVGFVCGFAAFNYVVARTIGVQFGQYRLELVKGPELAGGI